MSSWRPRVSSCSIAAGQSQLGGGGGLTRALESNQHHGRGGLAGRGKLVVTPAEQVGKLFVDDLNHLLAGGKALQNVVAQSPLLDCGDEVPGHAKVDVSLQQGAAYFAQCFVNFLLGEPALAGQTLEYAGELVGQVVKHGS